MTQDKYSKILDQIKKLFALSKSNNPNESALAFSKAQELMLKYNIEQSNLVKDQIEDIIEIDFEMSKRFTAPNESLAYWIGEAFFCKPIKIRGLHTKLRFIGTKSDIAVASYIYDFVMNLSEKYAVDYVNDLKKKNPNKDWRGKVAKIKQDHSFGFIVAITEKLKKIKEEKMMNNHPEIVVQNALMVVKNDLISQYIANQYKNLREGNKNNTVSYNKRHFENGFEKGEKTGLHKGLDKKSNQMYIDK